MSAWEITHYQRFVKGWHLMVFRVWSGTRKNDQWNTSVRNPLTQMAAPDCKELRGLYPSAKRARIAGVKLAKKLGDCQRWFKAQRK